MPALFAERGGSGDRTLVLLHGLGANASVWTPLLPILEDRWPGRWIAPDLAGHGRSPEGGPYGYAAHAADVARLIGRQDTEIDVIGHSMGGVVGLALATGWFGIEIRRLLAFGVKIVWADEEVAKLKGLASAPVKWFDNRQEAIERYLKVSGLFGLMRPDAPEAETGVIEANGRFRLAAAPGITAAAGPDVADLFRVSTANVRLAAGANDPMVGLEDMTALDPEAVQWDAAGHNVHFERPELVWSLFESIET